MFLAFGTLSTLGLASACLSDLATFIPVDGGVEAGPASTGCGDTILATLDDGGDAGEECDPGPNAVLGCTPQCTISCGGVIAPSGNCYFLADPSDYNRALISCGAAGAHLVTIGSEDEQARVRLLVGAASYRLGLRVTDDEAYKTPPRVEEPGWPLGGRTCEGCFAVADDAGLFPSSGDAGGPQSCLVASARDEWVRVPCSEQDAGYLTVCEREPAGQRAQYCAGPYCTTLVPTQGKKRYVISPAKTSAAEADAFCRGYDGGTLVVFESREEREQLAREIRGLTVGQEQTFDVWIGLANVDGAWRWDDGQLVDAGRPSPWANGEPRSDGRGRAFMRFNPNAFDTQLAATATDDAGAEPKRFVCQRR